MNIQYDRVNTQKIMFNYVDRKSHYKNIMRSTKNFTFA